MHRLYTRMNCGVHLGAVTYWVLFVFYHNDFHWIFGSTQVPPIVARLLHAAIQSDWPIRNCAKLLWAYLLSSLEELIAFVRIAYQIRKSRRGSKDDCSPLRHSSRNMACKSKTQNYSCESVVMSCMQPLYTILK